MITSIWYGRRNLGTSILFGEKNEHDKMINVKEVGVDDIDDLKEVNDSDETID